MVKFITKTLGEVTSIMTKGIAPKYVDVASDNTIIVLNQKCNRDFSISLRQARLNDCSKKAIPQDRILKKFDVLINSTGTGTAGRVAQLFDITEPMTIDGHMILIRPTDEIDPIYYGYAVKAHHAEIEQLAEGSTGQTEINRKRLSSEIIISFPAELDKQRQISRFLYHIDQKIWNNKAINDNLQEQAIAIYANMVIDKAYDSWSSGILSDIAEITMGQSPKGDTYNEEGIGTVFFQGRAEFGFRFPTRRLFTTDPKRMAKANDALMSVRAPVGDMNVAYEDCCIGRGLSSIRSKDNHQSFVLYTMFALREELNVFNGEGTVFGSINRDALNSMPISIPPKAVMDQFEEIVAPMDATIRNNYEEICRLEAIRDSLLSRLMSGELDVSNIDI